MPLKLNVGLSRKVGEANYGSRGASVNLELELDSAIVSEPGRLQERIRQMFVLAKQSIDEELHHSAGVASANKNGNGHAAKDDHRNATSSRNGSNGNGNGHSRGYQRGSTTPVATASQVRALHAIANRQGLNLEAVIRDRFNAERADTLSISEASELIDELKGTTAAAAGGRR